ncbi:hypothetical protein C4569_02925 [Candidatus Parcubacteria bacterium]|nr:MAG: hypothetical protein C4569_02925 [Candidatus Parcubacteria bacterium]
MKIYFAGDKFAKKLNWRYQKIIDILTGAGNTVMTNLDLNNASQFDENDVEKFQARGETLLEQMDSLLLEITSHFPESGYLLALALAHKKPTIFLAETGIEIDKNIKQILNDKNAAQLLEIKSYRPNKISKAVLEFLEFAEKKAGREVPRIKFTLRITPKIERYLHWKTLNTNFSKADFLREQIEKMISEDEEFKKFNP